MGRKQNFTQEEDDIIIRFYSVFPNNWEKILDASPLLKSNGRTPISIQKRWTNKLKKPYLERLAERRVEEVRGAEDSLEISQQLSPPTQSSPILELSEDEEEMIGHVNNLSTLDDLSAPAVQERVVENKKKMKRRGEKRKWEQSELSTAELERQMAQFMRMGMIAMMSKLMKMINDAD